MLTLVDWDHSKIAPMENVHISDQVASSPKVSHALFNIDICL